MPASSSSAYQIIIESTNSISNTNNVHDVLNKKNQDWHLTDSTNYILKRRHSWSKHESDGTDFLATSNKDLIKPINTTLDFENLDPNGNHLISLKIENKRSFKDIRIIKSVSHIK